VTGRIDSGVLVDFELDFFGVLFNAEALRVA
jgi:hypothetical protein